MATLKDIQIHGWLKDVNDNFDTIVREFAGTVAAVAAPPESPATSVEVPARAGMVIIPDDGAQTPGPIPLTLLDPTDAEEGNVLTLYSVVAEEHTLSLVGPDDENGDATASAGFNGDATKNLATWDGGAGDVAIGDKLVLVAYDNAWYVLANTNVTLSTAT